MRSLIITSKPWAGPRQRGGSQDEDVLGIPSHRCYFAFGALVSEQVSNKIKGEPFINGQAVPYDPKYHEDWIKNNARAMERNRHNGRPRKFYRSRNLESRRENREFQNQTFQNNMPNAPSQGSQGGMPPNNMGPTTPGHPGGIPPNYQGGMQQNYPGEMSLSPQGGRPPNYQGGMQQIFPGGMPPNNFNGIPPNHPPRMPPNNMSGGMSGPPPNVRGMQLPNNMRNMPPPQHNYMGGAPQNTFTGPPLRPVWLVSMMEDLSHQTKGGPIPPQRDPVNYTPTRDPSSVPGGYNNY